MLHKLKCFAIVRLCVSVYLKILLLLLLFTDSVGLRCKLCEKCSRNGIEPFLTFFATHFYSTRCAAPVNVCVGSNQYFTVHAYIQISMLKNLWALLHICTIYSYSCTQKERASHTLQLSPHLVCAIPKHTRFICSFVLFCFVSLRCVYSYLGSHKFHSFASCAKNKNKTEQNEVKKEDV